MSSKKRKARKLANVNRKITQLSSELETLQYMQDRLERELEPDNRKKHESDFRNAKTAS